MIITKQKSIEDILEYLKGDKKVFIVGCALCATTCQTGGEQEALKMSQTLKRHKKIVAGTVIIDPPCHLGEVKRVYRKNKKAIGEADSLLVMACGDGVQTIMHGTQGKKVHPALDTLFLGEVERRGYYNQKCLLCAECVLDDTAGLCPMTLCPKGMLNGPCGGSKDGKCEISKEIECVWVNIYKRLKELNLADKIKSIKPPKDNQKQQKPQRIYPHKGK